jgi:pyroglutamyl-peptidase
VGPTTVLLTGFDAFGNWSTNPSALVTQAVAGPAGDTVVGNVLPTSYSRAGSAIERLLLSHRPQAALLLGLHPKAEQLVFERVARNRDDSPARDNDGVQHVSRVIVPGAPAQYAGTLPWAALHGRARCEQVDAVDSDDAGGFVCNHVYYRAVHCVAGCGLLTQVGFVHLPDCASSADLDRVVRCIRAFVRLLTDAGPDPHPP